jgi:hypothetical protein
MDDEVEGASQWRDAVLAVVEKLGGRKIGHRAQTAEPETEERRLLSALKTRRLIGRGERI